MITHVLTAFGRPGEDAKLLLRRFFVRSALAFLIIGVLVHFLVRQQVEARYQGFAEFHAEFVSESLLKHELAATGALDGTATGEEQARLQAFVDEYVMHGGDILRLKVWAPDGTIVVADDPALAGQHSPGIEAHLASVLENGPETERESGASDSDIGALTDTIETYVPIWVAGEGAVVELYQDLGPTIAAAHEFTRSFDLVLVAGLGTLWGLLIPIVRRAARRLEQQKDELERLLALEKDTVSRLEELGEMKDTFLTAVSHELRTPLTVLKSGTATLIQHGHALNDELRDDLMRRIGRNADRLESLLASLLDLDRLTRGTLEPVREPTDLEALVTRVVDMVAPERPVIRDVPRVLVDVDPSQIERIVENLVVNAMRHTPEGAGVRVGADIQDHDVVLRVEDDGNGVSDDLKLRIFEPFTQGPALHPESPGTGVGLALVHRFAELNGGRAWVEDAPSGGASFRVSLPRAVGTRTDSVQADGVRADTVSAPA